MKCGVRADGNSGSGGWAKRKRNNNDSLAHTVAPANAAYRRTMPFQGSDGHTNIAGWSDHVRPTGIWAQVAQCTSSVNSIAKDVSNSSQWQPP